MTNNGALLLKVDSLIRMYEQVRTYEKTVQKVFYDQCKNAYKLSKTNHFRGVAADSFKSYLSDGAINIISGFLDITAALTASIQLFAEAFFQYEKNHSGAVGENTLDDITIVLKKHETTFDSGKNELRNVINEAAQYITTRSLNLDIVNTAYSKTHDILATIRNDLYSTDDSCVKEVNQLMERIQDLRQLIQNITGYCYDSDGKLVSSSLDIVANQPWFNRQSNAQLFLMWQEDPFVYEAGQTTLSEDQWVAGLCSDVYVYAGYSICNTSYEMGVEDGAAFLEAKFILAERNAYAQFTDYLRASISEKFCYAETDMKVGFSDKYVGFHITADVGIARADGSIILGTDDFNAYIKGEAKLLCADGKAAFEFQNDGQFAIGFDASATLVSAEVNGGFSILGYKEKDAATGETKQLLGFEVSPEGKIGTGAALWFESKTAIEGEYININATTVKIKAVLGVGGEISLTAPTLCLKWPW